MELRKNIKMLLSYPSASIRQTRQEIAGHGAITISKILSNAIKMKASYNGGLLKGGLSDY